MCESEEEGEAPDYSSLFDAIDSAKSALKIYSDQNNQNLYGIALQQF